MMKADPGIRKAAILVSSLDRATAKLVLRQLGTADAGRVVQMMTQIGEVPAAERRRVLDEFFRNGPQPPAGQPGDDAPPKEAKPRRPVEPPAPEPAADKRPRRFKFLDDAEPEAAAYLLARERPQVIALVLAHLPPQQSSRVLGELESALQVEVLRRLVDLEQTDPGIVDEIEQVLVERMSELARFERPRMASVDTVAGILSASPETGPRLYGNLSQRDRALADRLTPEPVEFDQFARFDDMTLGTIFRSAELNLAALALMGSPAGLVHRVLGYFPPEDAAWLHEQLQSPGPMRLSDVEDARHELAMLASRLAAEGRIRLGRGG